MGSRTSLLHSQFVLFQVSVQRMLVMNTVTQRACSGGEQNPTHTQIEDRADCHSPCIIHNAGFEALRLNQYTLETACYSDRQNYGQYP